MFGLGMGELLVIMAIALIFLGPKRLPDVATTLGKAIRSFRKATSDLTSQLEIDESVKAPLRELQSALRDDPVHVKPLVMSAPASTAPVIVPGAAPVSPPTVPSPPPLPSGTAAPPLVAGSTPPAIPSPAATKKA